MKTRLLSISAAALVAVLGAGCAAKGETKFHAVQATIGDETTTTTGLKFNAVKDRIDDGDTTGTTSSEKFESVPATLEGTGTKTFDDLSGRRKAEFVANCIEIRGLLKKLLDSYIAGDLLGKDDPDALAGLIKGYGDYLDLCSDAEPTVAPGMASMLSDLKEKQAG